MRLKLKASRPHTFFQNQRAMRQQMNTRSSNGCAGISAPRGSRRTAPVAHAAQRPPLRRAWNHTCGGCTAAHDRPSLRRFTTTVRHTLTSSRWMSLPGCRPLLPKPCMGHPGSTSAQALAYFQGILAANGKHTRHWRNRRVRAAASKSLSRLPGLVRLGRRWVDCRSICE